MNIKLVENKVNTAKLVISDNSNPNKYISINLYYSYNTLIAIKDIDNVIYVSENIYSNTTGKYLDKIEPNKMNRLKREIFEKLANKIIDQISFNSKPIKNNVIAHIF